MEWAVGIVIAITLFFLLTPNPAKKASVRNDIQLLIDESVVREHARVTRWLTHYIGASDSFRNMADSTGTHDSYQTYHAQLTEELKRRDFVRRLLASIPEFSLLGEVGYTTLLNDEMMKGAWRLRKLGRSEEEVRRWAICELSPDEGVSLKAEVQSKESKSIKIIRDVVELIKVIYLYKEDPIALDRLEMQACGICLDDYTRATFVANMAYSFRILCNRSVFSGSEDERVAFAQGLMDKHNLYAGGDRTNVLSQFDALATELLGISEEESAKTCLNYVLTELGVAGKSIERQFVKSYMWWHIRPVPEMLNNAFLQAGYRGLMIKP